MVSDRLCLLRTGFIPSSEHSESSWKDAATLGLGVLTAVVQDLVGNRFEMKRLL